MRFLTRPWVLATALFMGLVVFGAAFLTLIESPPTSFDRESVTTDFLPLRIGFYLVVVGGWDGIARLLARPRSKAIPDDIEPDTLLARQHTITERLLALRWHVAGFFALFELIFVQRPF